MWKLFLFLILLATCSPTEQGNQKPFPVPDVLDDTWATYEGRWLTEDGVVLLELSLKSGAFGIDSYYKLRQRFVTDKSASGSGSQNLYSTFTDQSSKELKICLHNLGD